MPTGLLKKEGSNKINLQDCSLTPYEKEALFDCCCVAEDKMRILIYLKIIIFNTTQCSKS